LDGEKPVRIDRGLSYVATLILSEKTTREGRAWLSVYHRELDKNDNIEAGSLWPHNNYLNQQVFIASIINVL
jgi:hypothetical protein